MLARNRKNFHLVEALVVSNNIDIFCISETFLDSSVNNIYVGLNINGYTLALSDYPSNTVRSSVAIFSGTVIRKNDISSLNESIFLEIVLANSKCFLTGLYRSPSQSKDLFDESCESFNNSPLNLDVSQ